MKIYLSGVRTWHSYFMRGCDKYGAVPSTATLLKYTFPTFWRYYKRRGPQALLRTQPGESTIVDSGAHTFFGQSGLSVHKHTSTKEAGNVDLGHYHQAYMEFFKINFPRFDYFVELDVADVYGIDVVRTMRADYKEAGLWEKCITAFHRTNGADDYSWMLDNAESGYVALQGLRVNEPMLPYVAMIKRAYDRGIKVHGFALLNQPVLEGAPFYSIDCTSWLISQQYRRIIQFRRGVLKQTSFLSQGVAARKTGPYARGRHPHKFRSIENQLSISLAAIRQFEHYVTDLWCKRGVDWDAQIAQHAAGSA